MPSLVNLILPLKSLSIRSFSVIVPGIFFKALGYENLKSKRFFYYLLLSIQFNQRFPDSQLNLKKEIPIQPNNQQTRTRYDTT